MKNNKACAKHLDDFLDRMEHHFKKYDQDGWWPAEEDDPEAFKGIPSAEEMVIFIQKLLKRSK